MFSIGDRVKVVRGCWKSDVETGVNFEKIENQGTIIGIREGYHNEFSIEFNKEFSNGHNCGGRGKYGYCYYIYGEDLELIKQKKNNNMEVYR